MNKSKRNIVLVVLSMIAGLVYLTPFLRFSFYHQMREALSLSHDQLGTIGLTYGLFNVLGYIPSGFLAEKFSTKMLLIVSTLGMCLTTLWYSTFPDYSSLIVIHALYGIFSVGTFWSPYLKAIRNLGTDEEQGRLFGMSEGLRGVGQTAVAFASLGVLSSFATVAAGFRAALFINAAAFAILMVLVIVLVPDIIFVIMCGYTLWNTVNGYAGAYCTDILKISENLSSSLSIFRSFLIVPIAGFTGGFLMDKFSSKGKGMFIAFSCVALCVAAIYLSTQMVVICAVLTIVLGYFVNVIKATYWSIMGEAGVPLATTGMATGVISLIGLTPDIFTPKIIGLLLQHAEEQGNIAMGYNYMWLWAVVWAVLGIGAAMILKRRATSRRRALAGSTMAVTG